MADAKTERLHVSQPRKPKSAGRRSYHRTIQTAEYVGYATLSARFSGSLPLGDVFNRHRDPTARLYHGEARNQTGVEGNPEPLVILR